MEVNTKILSDITIFNKYAKYLPELQRRETWEELVERNKAMHIKKYPQLEYEILRIYKDFVLPKKVLPSMRSLQFAGKPIDVNPSRVYNCAYLPIESLDAFSETMFLLLGGTGVGYSVQQHHIDKVPEVLGPKDRQRRYLVPDSIEGWADSIKVLFESYMNHKSTINFDYSDVRAKGTMLVTSGGKAPGPAPLKECIVRITNVLHEAIGRQLTSLECHDILCYIADAVLAGGIRRAAMISLFSADDDEMLTCKSGSWWELNPQRGRANNSAVLVRHRLDEVTFRAIMKKTELSKAGEPGIYLTNDQDWGTNPCCEIALRPYQFCNLTEINVSDVKDQEDLELRATAASFIGTLQAGYTDFHYLRSIWQKTTEKDALIGVSMTGIASGAIDNLDLVKAANAVKNINKLTAEKIGINKAARTTCVKPAGTTSLVLGTASGIHAAHNDYYIRRMRVLKNESLYTYLSIHHPELLEDDVTRPHDTAIISVPIKSPKGTKTRDEPVLSFLERVKKVSTEWVATGHRTGNNTHNVSATINVREDNIYGHGIMEQIRQHTEGKSSEQIFSERRTEWNVVTDWMWENKECYNGLSCLPYDGGSYQQAPFEDISKETYFEMSTKLHGLDLTKVVEVSDNTNLKDQAACAGNACEIV
jgi:ribonucleoside-triphosphate reductase